MSTIHMRPHGERRSTIEPRAPEPFRTPRIASVPRPHGRFCFLDKKHVAELDERSFQFGYVDLKQIRFVPLHLGESAVSCRSLYGRLKETGLIRLDTDILRVVLADVREHLEEWMDRFDDRRAGWRKTVIFAGAVFYDRGRLQFPAIHAAFQGAEIRAEEVVVAEDHILTPSSVFAAM